LLFVICAGAPLTSQLTVCIVPTFQTEWLFGRITGGTNTSRCESSIGAPETRETKARIAKRRDEMKKFIVGKKLEKSWLK